MRHSLLAAAAAASVVAVGGCVAMPPAADDCDHAIAAWDRYSAALDAMPQESGDAWMGSLSTLAAETARDLQSLRGELEHDDSHAAVDDAIAAAELLGERASDAGDDTVAQVEAGYLQLELTGAMSDVFQVACDLD